MKADPDRACPHENFNACVTVNRLTAGEHENFNVGVAVNLLTGGKDGPVAGYMADIRVQCKDCGEPFRWIGTPAGLSPRQPMVSVDETELRAPLRPASSDPDFGLGLPGFAIRQVR